MSSAATWWVTERCVLYHEQTKEGGQQIIGVYTTLPEFYSKLPEFFDPYTSVSASTDINTLLRYAYYNLKNNENDIIVRATYTKTRRNPDTHMRAEFKFKNVKVLCGSPPGYSNPKAVTYFEGAWGVLYYTPEEYMFNYHDTGYEKGEEYLLILQYDSELINYNYSKGTYLKQYKGIYCINKLSGEYPSIKMFPGPVEYDATYFGAETKYVTADEFVELFMKAVNDYSVLNEIE